MGMWQRIEGLMTEAKISQSELARQCKLSQSNVNRLKNDPPNPSAVAIIAISEHFKVRPAWVLHGRGPKYEAPLTDSELELIGLWRHPVIERLHSHLLQVIKGIIADIPLAH